MKKKNYLERYFNTKIWNILYFSGFGVIAAGAAAKPVMAEFIADFVERA